MLIFGVMLQAHFLGLVKETKMVCSSVFNFISVWVYFLLNCLFKLIPISWGNMDENVMISPQLVWWTRFKPTISPIRYILLKLAVKKHLMYLIKLVQFCIAFFLYKQNLFCVMICNNCPNLLQHHNCFINDYFLIFSIYYIFYHQCRMITTLFIMRWNCLNDFFLLFFIHRSSDYPCSYFD